MHDQVKWLDGSQVRYGICYGTYGSYHSKNMPRPGHVYVGEAISGRMYEIPEVNLTDIPFDYGKFNHETGEFENCDEYHTHVQNEYKKAAMVSKALGPGLKLGKLFSIGVADGAAWYVVTAITKKSCTIEWRGYDFDRYQDQILRWGGKFPRNCIEPLVREPLFS